MRSSVGRVATCAHNYKASYGADYADRPRPVTTAVGDGAAECPMLATWEGNRSASEPRGLLSLGTFQVRQSSAMRDMK
jgi:hypothetical protein